MPVAHEPAAVHEIHVDRRAIGRRDVLLRELVGARVEVARHVVERRRRVSAHVVGEERRRHEVRAEHVGDARRGRVRAEPIDRAARRQRDLGLLAPVEPVDADARPDVVDALHDQAIGDELVALDGRSALGEHHAPGRRIVRVLEVLGDDELVLRRVEVREQVELAAMDAPARQRVAPREDGAQHRRRTRSRRRRAPIEQVHVGLRPAAEVVHDEPAVIVRDARRREVRALCARENTRIGGGVRAERVEEDAREIGVFVRRVEVRLTERRIARVVKTALVVQPRDVAPLRARDALCAERPRRDVEHVERAALVAVDRDAERDERPARRRVVPVERRLRDGVLPGQVRRIEQFARHRRGQRRVVGAAVLDDVERRLLLARLALLVEDAPPCRAHVRDRADGEERGETRVPLGSRERAQRRLGALRLRLDPRLRRRRVVLEGAIRVHHRDAVQRLRDGACARRLIEREHGIGRRNRCGHGALRDGARADGLGDPGCAARRRGAARRGQHRQEQEERGARAIHGAVRRTNRRDGATPSVSEVGSRRAVERVYAQRRSRPQRAAPLRPSSRTPTSAPSRRSPRCGSRGCGRRRRGGRS